MTFPQLPYKLSPPIKNIFTCTSFFSNTSIFFHFHCTLFSWAYGSLHELWKIFSFCAFICLLNKFRITHLFLNGFQPNLFQYTSPMYALPVMLFSGMSSVVNAINKATYRECACQLSAVVQSTHSPHYSVESAVVTVPPAESVSDIPPVFQIVDLSEFSGKLKLVVDSASPITFINSKTWVDLNCSQQTSLCFGCI